MNATQILANNLHNVIKSISQDENTGWHRISKFDELIGVFRISSNSAHNLPKIDFYLHAVTNSLWSIETCIYRLDWQKNLLSKGQLSSSLWFTFARADVRNFHVEFRALLDYVAALIKRSSKHPDQFPSRDSFRKLRNKCKKLFKQNAISSKLFQLINKCEWFDPFREIRDAIVHHGAETLVFKGDPGEPILFQVYKKGQSLLASLPRFITHEQVVDFERYSAYYLAELYIFLDKLAHIFGEEFKLDLTHNRVRRASGGLGVIQKWITHLSNLPEFKN